MTRSRSDKDERIVLVALTDQGRAIRDQAREIPQALLCQSAVSEQQAVELRDSLKVMLSALD
jgi:DNA-binding MarR family transcriptional regulator